MSRLFLNRHCIFLSSYPQVCPMNTSPHVDPHKSGHEVWEEFSHSFTPAVREVVEFAKRIPGFRDLSQHDQVSLLKAGTFEVSSLFSYRSVLQPRATRGHGSAASKNEAAHT